MLKHIFTAALLAAAVVADIEREDNVLVLTDDNFDTAIAENENILVEFMAPWCGHCKQLKPEYAKAATYFVEHAEEFDFKVELGVVDATEHSESASKFGVSGYPTLKFFQNGEAIDYSGGRTSEAIIAWLKKRAGPATVTVEDAAALEALKEKNEVVVVFADSDLTDANAELVTFTRVAQMIEDVVFAVTSDFSLIGVEAGVDKIVIFRKFDEPRLEYEGGFLLDEVATFVQKSLLPYVIEFNDQAAPKVFGGSIRQHILYFRLPGTEGDAEVIDAYRNVAKNHRDMLFVAVTVEGGNTRIAEFFGLSEDEDYPAMRIINIEGNPVKFVPTTSEFTEEGFDKFVTEYQNGNIEPHLKSEEVPEDWDEDDVKVIVGKNFKEQVLNDEVNVLLMAHAPWCGHCKNLMPEWAKLAEMFAEDETVMIATMDATANEVSEFDIQGFPTLKFFPAHSNGMILEYEGERTAKALAEYVEANKDGKGKDVYADEEDDEEEEEDKDEL